METIEPGSGDNIGNELEEPVGSLDGRKGLLGHLPGERKSGAHHRQRTLPHRGSPHARVLSI